MKKFTFLVVVAMLVLVPFVHAQNNYFSGEVLVRLHPNEQVEELMAEANQVLPGATFKADILVKHLNMWHIKFKHTIVSNEAAMDFLGTHKSVRVAQYNHTDVELRATPNDPSYSTQWGYPKISAPAAWDVTTGGYTANGDRIVVAVIDGGFYLNHPDVSWYVNVVEDTGTNGVDDDGNGYIDDKNGWDAYGNDGNLPTDNHGTHVAGTVAAKGNNSQGVTGVSWDADVMAIAGSSGNESTVLVAYGYAHKMRDLYNTTGGAQGAYVVATNSSFGVNGGDPNSYPLWCGFYDDLGAVGILSAGATANINWDIDANGDVPTACGSEYMIAVTNTNSSDNISGAGYGATTIDLGAPGTSINSTYGASGYNSISGTSMATPHVAGSIGLMYAAACESMIDNSYTDPDSIARAMRDYIFDNVDLVGSLSGQCVTGGRLNLDAAVQGVLTYDCSGLAITTDYGDATCGNFDGWAEITGVTGNLGSVTYQWDDPGSQTTALASGLEAGTYTCTITDLGSGSTTTAEFTLINSNEPTLSGTDEPVKCRGGSDGEATVTMVGGQSPFGFLWDDPSTQSTQTAVGLPAGNYTVTVTDANTCEVSIQIAVTEPLQAVTVNFGMTPNTDAPPNGAINLTVIGGTPPYDYAWDHGPTTEDLNGIMQGDYTVTITDDNGCTAERTISVSGEGDVGIGEYQHNADVQVYPNPSQGVFNVSVVNSSGEQFTLAITNLIGQEVFADKVFFNNQNTLTTIDVSGLQKGVYFLNISSNNMRSTRRIVLE